MAVTNHLELGWSSKVWQWPSHLPNKGVNCWRQCWEALLRHVKCTKILPLCAGSRFLGFWYILHMERTSNTSNWSSNEEFQMKPWNTKMECGYVHQHEPISSKLLRTNWTNQKEKIVADSEFWLGTTSIDIKCSLNLRCETHLWPAFCVFRVGPFLRACGLWGSSKHKYSLWSQLETNQQTSRISADVSLILNYIWSLFLLAHVCVKRNKPWSCCLTFFDWSVRRSSSRKSQTAAGVKSDESQGLRFSFRLRAVLEVQV